MIVQWGVIGAGGIADRRTIPEGLIPAANAELAAVCDTQPDRAAAVAAKYCVEPFESCDGILASDDVQAVYIASPTQFHRDHAIAAARAGKHVLCEKPLALTVTQCEEVVQACADAGVKLGVNFMMRFHACHRRLADMVAQGELGTLVFGRAELTCWYPPIPGAFRQDPALGGGGALADMGNHCIDVLEMYFGRTVEVSAKIGNLVQDYASEDTAVCMLRFESGAVGVIDALFNVPDAAARNALEVYGSKGSVVSFGTIGQDSGGELRAVLERGDKAYDASQVRDTASPEETIRPEPVNIYRAHIEAFSHAILANTPPPIPGEAGLWNHRVVEACYEAARTGAAVPLT
ncbi:MAG: Gfo/Idh/MocA family oxidoreductase [Armatimonadetes bacterium]|nr:Gfo/Idh/MocA family oxidoreductase [Armatimonadota bacterium]